jgi:hypothetical protein
MALLTPPFPPSGRYVEYVRESSRALTQAEAVTVSVAPGQRFQFLPLYSSGYHRTGARLRARVMRAAVPITHLIIESFGVFLLSPLPSRMVGLSSTARRIGISSNYVLSGSI